jgi:hypothetical protein
MDKFAAALIDALGGTTEVARFMSAPVSTVHNMRTKRLTGSRLNHLRRIARDERPSLDVAALASDHGFELPPIAPEDSPSCGKTDEVSQQVTA